MSYDNFTHGGCKVDKPTPHGSRRDEVDVTIQQWRECSRSIPIYERDDLARTLADEVDELRGKLDWAQQIIKAQEETSNGVACARERAAGNGGCGACSWCCAQANAKLDDVRQGIGCARGQRTTQYCAEAVARDEIIGKLLKIICDARGNYFGSVTAYDRAIEIAGRKE